MCKILAISDTHGYLPKIPPCDLLLLAGDYCSGYKDRDFLMGDFADWLRNAPAQEIVGIAGNHDWEFQRNASHYRGLRWHYLEDTTIELMGLTIHGTPWTPKFMSWAFMDDDDKLRCRFGQIPKSVDILISHGPPLGLQDRNSHGEFCGSKALWEKVRLVGPRLHVFGHIHEGRGETGRDLHRLDGRDTIFANVSHVNGRYEPVHTFFDASHLFG